MRGVAVVFPFAGIGWGGGGNGTVDQGDGEAALAAKKGNAAAAEDTAAFEAARGLPGGAEFGGEGAELLAPVEFDRPAEILDGAGGEQDIVLGFVALIVGVAGGEVSGPVGDAAVGGFYSEAKRARDVIVDRGPAVETAAEFEFVAEGFVLDLEPRLPQGLIKFGLHRIGAGSRNRLHSSSLYRAIWRGGESQVACLHGVRNLRNSARILECEADYKVWLQDRFGVRPGTSSSAGKR